MRVAVKLVLLMYVAGATWSLTTRFVAWGDDVSVLVGTVARAMTVAEGPVESAGGGLDFVECMCEPNYSGRGVQYAALGLFVGGAPLALATSRRRRRWLAGDELPSSGGAQAGFLLQLLTFPLTILVTPLIALELTMTGTSVASVGMLAIGLLNIVCGVPALADWRRLQVLAFGVPRPLLRLNQPRVFLPVAGQ